ncbi:LysE family translocator [Cereibacter sphaeroides]|uniref:LysE family translocator n=1 Tax=Cereibacter johrii TaxID=445629 RepID=UPI000C6CD045|nr:LysE family translocator [Cereibacter sphaeroides f. sp. denitrificans]
MLFLKALLMGLAIAAPLGPIGALCIQRTLAHGFRAGMAGGLGTALADACYAAAAAGGFAAFAAVLDRIQLPLGLGGGLFLIWLGVKGLRTEPPAAAAAAAAPRGLWSTLAATFLLTLANPATILSFAAIFAGLGLAREADLASGATVVAGVFAGSMLWWILLAGGVAMAQRRLPRAFATWVARASGGLMLAFGLWAIAAAFG